MDRGMIITDVLISKKRSNLKRFISSVGAHLDILYESNGSHFSDNCIVFQCDLLSRQKLHREKDLFGLENFIYIYFIKINLILNEIFCLVKKV